MINKCLINKLKKIKVGELIEQYVNNSNAVLFIKINKNTVKVYLNSYNSINSKPCLSINLKNEHISINRHMLGWRFYYILSQNILDNVSIRYERNGYILKFANNEIVPFNNMVCDVYGNLLIEPPKYAIKEYKNLKIINREEINASARSRYHNEKAVQRLVKSYELSEIYGGFDWDTKKVERVGNYTVMDDVFKLHNVSHRRILIDYYGIDTILGSLKHKSLDKNTFNNSNYELIEVHIPDLSNLNRFRPCNYLKMVNPSTNEIHFEGVNNDCTTVDSALVWRNNQPIKQPIKMARNIANINFTEPVILT